MSSTSLDAELLCQSCGACCESYRVSFYWAETLELGIPDAMVEQLTPWNACLRGTNSAMPRCAALTGTVGDRVACGTTRITASGIDQLSYSAARHRNTASKEKPNR